MNKKHLLFLLAAVLILVWSVINPKDYLTWVLEVTPGVIGMVVLMITYRKFKFTTLVYFLILIHCTILFAGGKYTYAENPLFEWLKNIFSMERNNYDKLGHFAQGFVPTMIARELLIRLNVINKKSWLPFILLSITMFISSMYELIEWASALLIRESADAFLGMQGYVWDTQSDMFYALLGSIAAILFLSRIHDKYINNI